MIFFLISEYFNNSCFPSFESFSRRRIVSVNERTITENTVATLVESNTSLGIEISTGSIKDKLRHSSTSVGVTINEVIVSQISRFNSHHISKFLKIEIIHAFNDFARDLDIRILIETISYIIVDYTRIKGDDSSLGNVRAFFNRKGIEGFSDCPGCVVIRSKANSFLGLTTAIIAINDQRINAIISV